MNDRMGESILTQSPPVRIRRASEHSHRVVPIETDGENPTGPHLRHTHYFGCDHAQQAHTHSKSAIYTPSSVAPLCMVVVYIVGKNGFAEMEIWYSGRRSWASAGGIKSMESLRVRMNEYVSAVLGRSVWE
jgi:hypothetical protein